MSPKRSLLALAGVVAVAISLAGCSLLPGIPAAKATPAAAKPVSGQCWNATTTQAADWTDWQGTSAVVCTSSHTLYTYQVGKISGETSSSWAASGDGSQLSPEVQTKADDACSISTLLPHLKWNQQLIEQYFFVPTKAEWKAGQRWVRCDVGVLATGTTLNNESFTALPNKISTLVKSVDSDPLRYEFCVNSSEAVTDIGPLDNPDATLGDCSKDPQWKLATRGNLPEAAGAPFPDDATANTESTKICAPAATGDGQIWLAYLPTKTGWASGDREVDCWVGQKPITGGQTA
ncbi:MAG TPA: septum formation family protein [Galbitalea sp.]|nr:septum formation family protein [Galbitalea sp.]